MNYNFNSNLAYLCTGGSTPDHAEGIKQDVNIVQGVEYTLSFDYSVTAWNSYPDNGNQIIGVQLNDLNITDCITENLNPIPDCSGSNYCNEILINSTLTYPTFMSFNDCFIAPTNANSISFWTDSDNTNSSFLSPEGAFLDNIKLTCKSEQLLGIGYSTPTPTSCNFTFWADERPNSDIDILEYVWDFGDGVFGQGANITHTFTTGQHIVTLYIEDENGCCQIEEIVLNCEVIEADYCKYICHEEYLTAWTTYNPVTDEFEVDPFTCAVGVLYNDHNPSTPASQPLYFNQAYSHTDFVGIANEIETRFSIFGFNMTVNNYDPNGVTTCYKSACIGCDGSAIPPQFELDANGVPTGVVSGTWTGTTSLMTGNGIPLGTIFTNPAGVEIVGTSVPVTYTITISNNIDPTTVVVITNPNGPGFILQYEATEGIFAMGDVEILTVLGTSDFNSVYDPISGDYIDQQCDNNTIQSGQATKPFNFCP